MNAERILVDTSVWIQYFRGVDQALSEFMDELIDRGIICIPAIVIAELLQGSKTDAEQRAVEDLADAFTVIDQNPGTWIEAGKLSSRLRKKGKSVHLTDCYIAELALENSCALLSLDAHFDDIRGACAIELVTI